MNGGSALEFNTQVLADTLDEVGAGDHKGDLGDLLIVIMRLDGIHGLIGGLDVAGRLIGESNHGAFCVTEVIAVEAGFIQLPDLGIIKPRLLARQDMVALALGASVVLRNSQIGNLAQLGINRELVEIDIQARAMAWVTGPEWPTSFTTLGTSPMPCSICW